MALRTFTGALTPDLRSSQAGNWDTGVPVDTDTWIIPVGKTCTWDSDQSGFATGTDGTINGVLEASTTPGYYCIKLSANLVGTGTLRAGTSVTAYPQTCTFEIVRNTFSINSANLLLDLNCTEPTRKYVKCTDAEAAGQTVLEVDTDVTGDIWAAGNIVRIDDVNGVDSEERVIAAGGIAAGSITITAGLTNAKIAGALVILISRNVKITHTAVNTTVAINASLPSGRIFAEIRNGNIAFNSGVGHTIGGSISGCVYGLYTNVAGCTVGGIISGCSNGFYNASLGNILTAAGLISGCVAGIAFCSTTVMGLISGCASGFSYATGFVLTGTVSGCTNGVVSGSGLLLGATFANNVTADIVLTSGVFRGYNTSLNSATQVSYTTGLPAIGWQQVAIWNIGTVAGAFKAWMRGGRVQSQEGVVPVGRVVAYQHICESASFPVFMDRFAEVEPGDTITVNVWLRKDALMAYLPRCQVFRQENDPLLGGAVLTSVTMTDSLNTWEAYTLTWQNLTAGPVSVVVRTLAMAAANNLYADTEISNGTNVIYGGGVFG